MSPNSIETKDRSCIINTSAELKQDLTMHCYAMIAEKESCNPGKYFMFKAHLMQMLLLIMRELLSDETYEQTGCNIESYNKSYAVNRIISYLNKTIIRRYL